MYILGQCFHAYPYIYSSNLSNISNHTVFFHQEFNFIHSPMAASSTSLFLVFSSLLIFSSLLYVSDADYSAPIMKGLSWDYHHKTCHKLEKIVRKHLKKVFKEDVGQAAGLLRLHFHDCFVQVSTIYIINY